jgi:hypothetical protein
MSHIFSFVVDGWPLDRFMTKYTLISTNGVAFGLVLAFLTAGLIMSGAFLAFNIYYRNQR